MSNTSSPIERRFYGSLPPLHSSDLSETDYESDNGSLDGYYNKVVNTNDDELIFERLDGREVSFGSHSSLSNQESLLSTDTIFKLNESNFNYDNLSTKHIKWEFITIIVLLFGYAGKYFNSAHFYLIVQTWDSNIFDINQLISLCIVVILFCFFSKIILGTICDRYLISKEIFIITNILCGVSALLFAIGTPGWWYFSSIILGISIPGTWVALIGVLAHWIPINRQGRIFSLFSGCFLLCDIISFVSVEAVVYYNFSWKIYLVIVSIICIVCSFPAIFLLYATPKKFSLHEPPTLKASSNAFKPTSFKEIFIALYKNKELWLLSFLALEIYGICQYFLIYSWEYVLYCYCSIGDTQDNECLYSTSAKLFAVFLSLLFPFFGIISSFIVGILRDGISRRHRCCIITSFSIAFLLFFVLMHLLLNISNTVIAAIFISCCGITILGPYSLLCGVFAVDIGGKHRSSTVTGIIDSFGFISETVVVGTCYFYGSDSTQSFIIITILTILAIITSLILWKFDCNKRKILPDNTILEQYYSELEDDNYDYSFIESSNSINNSFKI